jgi:hypothetical protein
VADKTGIINVALRRIGESRIVNLDSDTSKEARAARDLYEEARDDLLRSHPWNFALKRKKLAQLATSPVFGWEYGYGLPADWIRTVSVYPFDGYDSTNCEYRMETQDISGTPTRVLLANSNQIYMRYVAQIANVALMAPDFREALAMRLARDLSVAMQKSSSVYEMMDKQYRRALSNAQSVDGMEDHPESFREGSWVTSRHLWDDYSQWGD